MSQARILAKSHLLRVDDTCSILEPADPRDAAFTASKGTLRLTTVPGVAVVFTVGPASCDVDTLCEMLEAGATVARIDLTWGTLDFYLRALAALKQAVKRTKRLCGIMVDTLGREVFVRREWQPDEKGWPRHANVYHIRAGEEVVFTTNSSATASSHFFPVNYPRLTAMVRPRDSMYVGRYLASGEDQGCLYVQVLRVTETEVATRALNEATLQGLLTIFHVERSQDGLENEQNKQPLLSEHDMRCIATISAQHDIDFLSLSYVHCGEDCRTARNYLLSLGLRNCRVVAKLETRGALLNFQGILAHADAIIMSRGHLGLDCLPQKIPMVQKNLISCCNMLGVPILLTRIVDSMTDSPRCTRAEATDVANAVLDGADGFLLGAETLRGRQPALTIRTVLKICKEAEKVFDNSEHFEHLMREARKVERAGLMPIHIHSYDHLTGHASDSTGDLHLAAPQLTPGSPGDEQSPLAAASHVNGEYKSRSSSFTRLEDAVSAMTHFAALPRNGSHGDLSDHDLHPGNERLTGSLVSKMESIASSSVSAATTAGASLIVVFTNSGRTAQLVAKYRPKIPILALVIPHLSSNGLSWTLEGAGVARSLLIVRGVMPMLGAPDPNGDKVLADAMCQCFQNRLLAPGDKVICIEQDHQDFTLKMLTASQSTLLQRLLSHSHMAAVPKASLVHTTSSALAPEAAAAAVRSFQQAGATRASS